MLNLAANKCLTKAFLDSVCPAKSGPDLYVDYFEKHVLFDEDVGISSLERFENGRSLLRLKDYRITSPHLEPAHFSFYSFHDVNRLAKQLGTEVIVYLHREKNVVQDRVEPDFFQDELLEPFHDFRCLSEPDDDDDEEDNNSKAVVYIVTSRGKLFKWPEHLAQDVLDLRLDLAAPYFAKEGWLHSRLDWSATRLTAADKTGFDNLVSLGRSVLEGKDSNDGEDDDNDSDGECDDDDDNDNCLVLKRPFEFLLASRTLLAKAWKKVTGQRSVVVVTFVRNEQRVNRTNHRKHQTRRPGPKQTRFITLAVVPKLSSETDEIAGDSDKADNVTEHSEVLCLYSRNRACLLAEPFRQAVIAVHANASGLKERLSNRDVLSCNGVSKKLSAQDLQELRNRQETSELNNKKKKKKTSKTRKRRQTREYAKMCQCETCLSNEYSTNMAASGPERLCSVPYTCRELLQMLGRYDDQAEIILNRLCELSVASMDIESRTVTLDTGDPRPGPNVVFREIAGASLEGHAKKVQKPVMIAHTDAMDFESGVRWSAVASSDSESSIYDMFETYWRHIESRYAAVVKAKQALAGPLLDIVESYRSAYFEYFNEWQKKDEAAKFDAWHAETESLNNRGLCKEDLDLFLSSLEDKYRDWEIPQSKMCLTSFLGTIPGLLWERLLRLINRYVVFTFYGYVDL